MDKQIDTLVQRIDELETKVSFLELTNQELSDLIYAQQQQIDKHMRAIAERLESLNDAPDSESPEHEVPPHY